MESESHIFFDFQDVSSQLPGSTPLLIREGRIFSYYRIEIDGKYFFFKTVKDTNNIGLLLLRKEYDIGVQCDSPHLPHIFLYGEFVKGKEGVLMEYIDGRTLTEFLSEKPSLKERKKIFSQLLETLSYLHKKGIVHNDLKPDNILVKHTGNSLALIDFGLSDNDAHFRLKHPGCTEEFAAPELKKSHISDVRSDIYSIGKLMGLLFGRRYGRFSSKCTRKLPVSRYASVDELRSSWEGRFRPFQIAAVLFTAVLIVAAVWLYMGEKAEWNKQLEEMGVELANQKSSQALQTEKYLRLQSSYNEVNESYQGLKESYKGMNDSIADSNKAVMAHEKAKQGAIEGFKEGLNKRMYATLDSLKLCSTWGEMNTFRQLYDAEVHDYFTSYPKVADGEDLTAVLSALLQANLEEARLLFNTELPRLHK